MLRILLAVSESVSLKDFTKLLFSLSLITDLKSDGDCLSASEQ